LRYLLMICGQESDSPGPAPGPGIPDCVAWSHEMQQRGVLLTSAGLRPSSDATTVRVRGDDVLLGDGPFAETKDQIGGFMMIECADLDEAIEVASKHPAAKDGLIEVRPVADL
jgi:hypothetical protein